MKNIKIYLGYLAVFALLFTSCSKEEDAEMMNSETAVLSFGAIVNDLVNTRAATKQAIGDMPDCNNDATADYVNIVLARVNGDGSITNVIGSSGNPYRVNLVSGQVFTEEDAALELEPGNYRLEHFAVYDEVDGDDDLIWLAPREGSDLANYIDNALPLDIDLRAGVKKYVDVSVLCFDNREVNQYGYLFFELDTNIALTYCFFANYCNDDGMHYPARYSISIWSGTNANGIPLYTNETNNTGRYTDGDRDFYATPSCFALPDNDDLDEEYLYYEITLLDWEENYGDVDQVMMSGTITKQDIIDNYGATADDNVEYEHIRFCGEDDGEPVGDRDNDNVPDNVDECPDTAGPASNSGCPVTTDPDSDGDGVVDSIDQCENTPEGTTVNAVGCPVTTDPDSDGDGVVDSIDQCENTPEGTTVDAIGCPVTTDPDSDGDGVVDSIDQCENTPSGTTVNAVGCPVDSGEGCQNLPDVCDVNFGTLPQDCYVTVLDGGDSNGYVRVDSQTDIDLMQTIINEAYGVVSTSISGDSVLISIDGGLPQDRVTAYEVEVRPSENGSMSSTCWESQCDPNVPDVAEGDQPAINLTFDDLQFAYPFYVRVNAVICESIVGE